MAGIYIHVPFCISRCIYCDFYSNTELLINDYINALKKEIICKNIYLFDKKIKTIYFGGGTPSLLSVNQLNTIFDCLEKNFNLSDVSEITFEANPDDLTFKYLHDIKLYTPINRLSIGIQSLNNDILTFFKRRHTKEVAISAIENALKSGFSNISADVIYGFKLLSINNLQDILIQLIDFKLPHISAYQLSIEKDTPLHKISSQYPEFIDDNISLEHYKLLTETLKSHDYEQYEISNFARQKMYSMHNSSYWDSTPYLGLGPGAHSYNINSRQWNFPDIRNYLNNSGNPKSYKIEYLSDNEKFNDYIITRLRTSKGIDFEYVKSNFGSYFLNYLSAKIKKYNEMDGVVIDNLYFRLTSEGFLLCDNFIRELLIV